MKNISTVYARCRLITPLKNGKKRRTCWSEWKQNLAFDAALNSLAGKSGGIGGSPSAAIFQYCQVGSGTNANSFPSGSITFTQATTVVTASAAFFTSAMVGAILKYGTGSGGAEYYITAYTNSTTVSVNTSATVASTVGTVWMVQQTALETPLYSTNSYQTTTGSCFTTFSGNQQTMQRTFNFALQSSSYNANEIGYSPASGTSLCAGRIVLGSTIVVGTTQFLQVQLQMVRTFSPGSPTAVANVGTEINTAGNAMIEAFSSYTVSTTGTNISGSTGTLLDQGSSVGFALKVGSAISQNAAPSSSSEFTYGTIGSTVLTPASTVAWSYVASSIGLMQASFPSSQISVDTQTCYGIMLMTSGNSAIGVFDINFTTPFTLPFGTYQPQPVFQIAFTRTLTN